MDLRLLLVAILCLGIGFLVGLITQSTQSTHPAAGREPMDQAVNLPPPNPPVVPFPPEPDLAASNAGSPPPPAVAIPAASLVDQVNDILKEMPRPAGLGEVFIKLEETSDGVRFWVGNTSYQGLEQIPGEAREFIRSAVRAWGGGS